MIWLEICEMEDNGHAHIPFSERLKRLHAHERAWRTLSWTDVLEINRRDWCQFSAKDGVFVQSYPIAGGTTFEFHRIPSSIHNIEHESWSWTLSHAGDLLQFHLEPAFDLFFLLCRSAEVQANGIGHTFHVLKLSTGGRHTLANNTPFHILSPSGLLSTTVYGSRLVARNAGFAGIYDWRSGMPLAVRLFSESYADPVRSRSYSHLAKGSSDMLHFSIQSLL